MIILKLKNENNDQPDLHKIGCLGKITSFPETNDGRYLIVIKGICRFSLISETDNKKLYREFNITFDKFSCDLNQSKKGLETMNTELILKNFKVLFEKQGYLLNWKELNSLGFEEIINNLSMSAPFTLEEKQMLIETINLNDRKNILEEILKTYTKNNITNRTLQ